METLQNLPTRRNRIRPPVLQGGVEVFTAGGKHEGKFEAAFASAVCCATAFSGLVWLGLASGRVVAVDCRTRGRAAAQDLHDSAVVSLQQARPSPTTAQSIGHVLGRSDMPHMHGDHAHDSGSRETMANAIHTHVTRSMRA